MCLLFSGSGSEVNVWLEMPRYAPRGSSVSLVCQHNVAQELLYRVEWRRAGGKLFQYVRNRSPSPYRDYPTSGAHINVSKTSILYYMISIPPNHYQILPVCYFIL